MAIAIGLLVLIVTVAIVGYTTWFLGGGRGARELASAMAAERAALRARLVALGGRVAALSGPGRSVAAPPDLAAAEALVASSPEDGGAHALLAWALLERGDLDAAMGEATRARTGGGALALLVEGRAACAVAARAAGSSGSAAEAALLTPGELAILQRERGRRIAGEPTPAPVAAHLRRYHDALASILAAAETDPAMLDAVHQAARVAIKVGLVAEGRALFDRIEPLVSGTAIEADVRRDLTQLRGDDLSGALARAEPAATARRSLRLRILR